MKIGLISSGPEILPLIQFLHKHDHEYHIFWDWKYWPRGDKSSKLVEERCQVGLSYLNSLGVDVCIVPPTIELQDSTNDKILPLFSRYVRDYCLTYSIVGKLGLLCDQADMGVAQDLIKDLTKQYQLTEHQQQVKVFHEDFPVWQKNVRMRKYFLTTYGKRSPMVRKTIKHDLAYFSDAGVDTLIPMSWGMLFYQKLVQSRTNFKRIRFHGLGVVEKCFVELTNQGGTSPYSMTIHSTDGTAEILRTEKKRQQLASRGGQIELKIEQIY